ncbi:MAG TPA: hypothetical protein VFH56_03435 [Acidimicrobiales bacterium]|nr:hypothetical protein [Acidimicrobiales bacterium]
MAKKKIPDGRYDGDWLAIVDFSPLAKYPWRVEVYEWVTFRDPEKTNWYEASPILPEFSTRDFKTAKAAIRYRSKVQRAADLGYLNHYQAKRVNDTRERVL